MKEPSIGLIGAGQMATALARGFVDAGLVQAADILASDPSQAAREAFARQVPGARVVDDNPQVARQAGLLLLAVKPQHVDPVLAAIGTQLDEQTLLVSIAAGVSLKRLARGLARAVRLVRVMPNTPCLISAGATGYSLGPTATDEDAERVDRLFSAVGLAVRLPETQLDAVTGLSGSGPAFVYTVVEALSDAGVLMGLPREVAASLAAQTVVGAARMVQTSQEHPARLRDRVTSPGGTTIAGLEALERAGLRTALIDAVRAATLRSRELGSGEAATGPAVTRQAGRDEQSGS